MQDRIRLRDEQKKLRSQLEQKALRDQQTEKENELKLCKTPMGESINTDREKLNKNQATVEGSNTGRGEKVEQSLEINDNLKPNAINLSHSQSDKSGLGLVSKQSSSSGNLKK